MNVVYFALYFFSDPKVQDLHSKLSSESKRADTLAFEMKRLEEKHEALLKEKEVIINVSGTFTLRVVVSIHSPLKLNLI